MITRLLAIHIYICLYKYSKLYQVIISYQDIEEQATMRLPKKTLSDQELLHFITKLKIPNFRTVCMRDELAVRPRQKECGILNLNTHDQKGTHWTCWFKDGKERYYFDSYG